MKLAIISHTEHYKTKDGEIVGWSPTVNEINNLLEVFDEIYHLAMLYNSCPPLSTMAYNSSRIKFIEIPAVGGRGFNNKLKILTSSTKTIRIVSSVLKKVDYFQLRTPTGIGVYLIPYLTFFIKTKGWFKYAGNWNQKNPPFGYKLQRWMLKNQKRKVTINGRWPNQPIHCITFENPCLDKSDLYIGNKIAQEKSFDNKLSFCFVGRLEREKGVGRIINAFSELSEDLKTVVDTVHLVGNGKELPYFRSLSKDSGIAFKFYKFLPRDEVFSIYKQSHVFLLPSTASEGFPKVIAEAMNFGCIPIVSNISSIGQYVIHRKNGLLIDEVSLDSLLCVLNLVFQSDSLWLKSIGSNNALVTERFTFSHYNSRIINEIL